ncbi:PI-actitoxin-Aeq3a-like [Mizuhopecten yessoensis]|uniref:Protease inhibitor LmKTT-1a n=1 Tax=Mizuhopecten yessoensis TaxID=6573 RepID=A0A210PZ59_MIZYE|nr:PI-actitoxin-Aeq3a-like [Mizuhopecten yessoensis]OWF41762.1 Protease inhibitor LmKTT-1a [Mizuhopecten yessoensis]
MKSCTLALVVLVTLSVIQLTVARKPVCLLPPVAGRGNLAKTRYYWDTAASRCRRFTFKGFGGNGNRFVTMLDCMASCRN